MLARLDSLRARFDADTMAMYYRLRAWVSARRGFLDGLDWLNMLSRLVPMTFSLVTQYVCVLRFQGLTPAPAIAEWIRRGEEILAREPGVHDGNRASFLGHQAFFLMRNGRAAEALSLLEQAGAENLRRLTHSSGVARMYAERGEANRLLGNRQQALLWLGEARRLQRHFRYDGERADFSLTYRAKLETNRTRARLYLERAHRIQTQQLNRMGEARTLLLQARLGNDPGATFPLRARVLELREQLPALGQCPLLARVLARWDDWTSGQLEPDEHGDLYWGV
jgi:tetratricopeptide (TPR) repeat protein